MRACVTMQCILLYKRLSIVFLAIDLNVFYDCVDSLFAYKRARRFYSATRNDLLVEFTYHGGSPLDIRFDSLSL